MILGDLENHVLPPVTIYAHAHTGPSHPDWTEVSPGSEKTKNMVLSDATSVTSEQVRSEKLYLS